MNKIILDYLKTNPEPYPDSIYGDGYRCSTYLSDGTFLPCVMLRSDEPIAKLAMRRFEEEKKGKWIFKSNGGYTAIVKSFVATGNRVNNHDIAKITSSRFSIPISLLRSIEGETTMAWTAFVFEMHDGRYFSYGTTFQNEFFDLPEGYEFKDVVKVHNHSYLSSNGNLQKFGRGMQPIPEDYDSSNVYREKPYFICYFDGSLLR